MAPLGGTGSLGGTGQTSSSRGSGGSAQGHDAPLVKTVFSKATTKTLQEVFSAQGKDPTSWWEFRAQVCVCRERERERESCFHPRLPLLGTARIKTNFCTHSHTHSRTNCSSWRSLTKVRQWTKSMVSRASMTRASAACTSPSRRRPRFPSNRCALTWCTRTLSSSAWCPPTPAASGAASS